MFLQSFAEDPAHFIQTWLESQSRDLENILGSGPSEGMTVRQEELRRSEFFQLPWVEEVCFFSEVALGSNLTLGFCRQLLFRRECGWHRRGCSSRDVCCTIAFVLFLLVSFATVLRISLN